MSGLIKIIILSLILPLLAGLPACKGIPEPRRESVEDEIAMAADHLAAAISRHDAEEVTRYFSRDKSALHINDGRLIPRARLLTAFEESYGSLQAINFVFEKKDVRALSPKSALLTAWAHYTATAQDGEKTDERAIFSLIYRQEGGRWKILRTHKSLLRSFPQSETSKARLRLRKFCRGNGIDLGYGGDPIVPSVITMDLPVPYTKLGDHPQNLAGDARDLYWFKDDVLDYVYSSHLLEDFSPEEMVSVLREWFRVIRIGGLMVIYSPDEQAYRAYCMKKGLVPNVSHKIADFGLKYLKGILEQNFQGQYSIEHEIELVDEYSFDLVLRKLK
ncbi:MAG: SgcJ/EcaC family oxidoreductase [Acidobacteriota bacterium]